MENTTMIKRLVTAALLAAVVSLSGCSEAKPGSAGGSKRMPHWRLAMMSYTFRNFSVFDAIDKTKELDLKYLEEFSWHKVGGPYGNVLFNDTASPEVREGVKKKLKEADVKLVGYYSNDLGKDEAATRRTFEFCKDMGIKYIVAEPEAKHMAMVDKLAAEFEVHVAIHNHPRNPKQPEYKNWNPDEVVKLFEGRSKWIGACADTGHWARSGVDTVAAIRKYKGRLVAVHLKDAAKAEPDAPDVIWGNGLGNLNGVLAELAHENFRGVFSIEYEAKPEDNMGDVGQCIKFFNQISNELAR
jgi:sugar phosphate isomerase/epimerase